MSTSSLRQTEKREIILQAARFCFIQHGFHSTGMAEICRAAHMSPGNLYRYFPGKSALIQAVAEDSWQRVLPIFAQLQDDPDPLEAIGKILMLSAQFLSDPEESRLWLEITAEASRNDEVKEALVKIDNQTRHILLNLLQRSAAAGQISLPHDPDLIVESFFVALNGAIAHGALATSIPLETVMAVMWTQIKSLLGDQTPLLSPA